MNTIGKTKLKSILRREMDKMPTDNQLKQLNTVYAFAFAQAKFDTLMDLDRELKIGAFYKQ